MAGRMLKPPRPPRRCASPLDAAAMTIAMMSAMTRTAGYYIGAWGLGLGAWGLGVKKFKPSNPHPLKPSSSRHLQLRHRLGREQLHQWFRQHSRRPVGARMTGAIGRDAGVRIHLAIELRDQHERQLRLHRLDAIGALPDVRQ